MQIQKNVPIGPFTTYKIGGRADLFVFARNRIELKNALLYALEHNIPYVVLGMGANILVSDKGFRGMVVRNLYNRVSIQHNHFLHAGSGASIEQIIHYTHNQNLSGFQHFAGIPSTVGGALWQNLHFRNANFPFSEKNETVYIADIVHHAYTLNLITGNENFLFQEEFKFGYDTSILHQRNHVVLDAVFQLKPGTFHNIGNEMRINLEWRKEKHPPLDLQPSCGSVFKKIEGIGAGRLIEQSGLKGFSIGGATVSNKHANFIVNTGNATASDIYQTIRHIQKVVLEKTGYVLETEIGCIGDFE